MRHAANIVAICLPLLVVGCSDKDKSNSPAAPLDGAVGNDGGVADGGGAGGGSKPNTNSNAGSGAGGTGAAPVDGGMADAALGADPNWMVPDGLQLCGGPCACADGMDNDGDGEADGFDSECTGAADNDEGSFATGIPGDNVDPKWQDCFFDGNSGAGNDGCRYSTMCLTGELPQDDEDCVLTEHCLEFCKPRTPNGCDCFGCCEVYKPDGTSVHVVLTSSCDEAHLDDCQTCTQSTDCNNDCGECELCAGKTPADLPARCSDQPGGSGGSGGSGSAGNGSAGDGAAGAAGGPPPPYRCEDGETVCDTSSDCGLNRYCAFGCCVLTGPE